MANKHKNMSTEKCQLKTMRYCHSLISTKSKTLTPPNTDNHVEKQELSLLVGMQKDTVTMEDHTFSR